MEVYTNTSMILVIVIGVCFLLFLIWIPLMVILLKNIPNNKIEALGNFFNKLPLKKIFTLLSNNKIKK